jgi:hypothetical protein
MDELRLALWYYGELEDDELTDEEIEWLEDAVREAVVEMATRQVH